MPSELLEYNRISPWINRECEEIDLPISSPPCYEPIIDRWDRYPITHESPAPCKRGGLSDYFGELSQENLERWKRVIRVFRAAAKVTVSNIKMDWGSVCTGWMQQHVTTNYHVLTGAYHSLSFVAHIDDCATHNDPLARISPEVRDYITRFGIENDVRKANELVNSKLPSGSMIDFSIEGDGESNELWLIANLIIKAPDSEVFQIFDNFVDVWIASLPKTLRRRTRLTYSVR